MPIIKDGPFFGTRPKISNKLLPPGFSDAALNTDIRTGQVRSFKNFVPVENLTSPSTNPTFTILSIYLLNSNWINFGDNVRVDIVKAEIANTTERFFYTGSGYPKQSNSILWPTAYRLGMVAPTTAPTTTAIGTNDGAGTFTTIGYVYTRVSKWVDGSEEESAPCTPTATITLASGQGIRISNLVAGVGTGNNVTHFRIYRLSVGTTGADYQYLTELAVAVTTYDDYSGTGLNEVESDILETTTWAVPPDTMEGLTQGSNGMMFGFVGNKIYVSEPYIPYAYPSGYTITIDHDIVAMRAYRNSIIVLTEGPVTVITGSEPQSLDVVTDRFGQKCASAQSAVVTSIGVMYATPDGLAVYNGQQGELLSRDIITKEDWAAWVPSSMMAFYYDEKYFCFIKGSSLGFVYNFKDQASLYSPYFIDKLVYGGYVDPDDDTLFLITKTHEY